MGYKTDFTLTIEPENIPVELFEKLTNEFCFEIDSGIFEANQKWYSHQSDMIQLSKNYPDLSFTLKRVGEENGDIWIAFFRNGEKEVRSAEIVLDENKPEWMSDGAQGLGVE